MRLCVLHAEHSLARESAEFCHNAKSLCPGYGVCLYTVGAQP